MPVDTENLPDDPAMLRQMLDELHAENDKLRLLIQRLTRHQFGRRSEQLTEEQLQRKRHGIDALRFVMSW